MIFLNSVFKLNLSPVITFNLGVHTQISLRAKKFNGPKLVCFTHLKVVFIKKTSCMQKTDICGPDLARWAYVVEACFTPTHKCVVSFNDNNDNTVRNALNNITPFFVRYCILILHTIMKYGLPHLL